MICGIEIHQRIKGGKLFCSCDSVCESTQKAASFSRQLHSVQSELGEIDSAVKMEAVRSRKFDYAAPGGCSCLVEADEEPPHPMNRNALRAVLVFCDLLSSRVAGQVHVMRKMVVDGSNTGGFQRTALVGLGGSINAPSGKLGIQSVCIEEESAGIISGKNDRAEYDLSRLGIALVEVATEPTLTSGKEAEQAAKAIGDLFRKTGLAARGLGTIRQDLNISIEGGARVEIKGVQDLSMVAKAVDLEAQRQAKLIQLSNEINEKAPGTHDSLPYCDLTEIFSETNSPFIKKMLRAGSRVIGVCLPGFAGVLGREILPGRRFGTELADYARSAGIKGIIHSDENLDKYGFSDDEAMEITAALSAKEKDAFVLAIADKKRAISALSEVAKRAYFNGVPEETRRANPDGTSSYMRPLPGSARMYPETDVPPIEITEDDLRQAKKEVKRILEEGGEKEELISQLNDELGRQLMSIRGLISSSPGKKSSFTPELRAFQSAVALGVEPKFAASTLTNTLQSLKREGEDTKNLTEDMVSDVFKSFNEEKFAKSAMPEVLRFLCKNPSAGPGDAVEALGVHKISGKGLEKLISEEKLDMKGLMAKYRLRVDSKEAKELFESNSLPEWV